MKPEQTESQQKFQETILKSVKKFAETTSKVSEGMLNSPCSLTGLEFSENGLIAKQKFFVSILFTGTIYGEYILAMDEAVGAALYASMVGDSRPIAEQLKREEFRQEMSEAFCEFLNIVVGESISSLGETYQKLTITSPRVYVGNLNYPKVRTCKAGLQSPHGLMECYLYIDQMKLDIAASYREAVVSLMRAHQELQSAMKSLQEQQTLLVQTEKMAALGTMAAGIAHEINTPLATVSLINDRLRGMVGASEFDRESFLKMLDVVEATVIRIGKITNGMRAFAQGVKNESFSSCSVKDIIDGTLMFCEKRLSEKKITLQYSILPDDIRIECRLPEISQVLLSLLNNACDAIEALDERWIRIEALMLTDAVEIHVVDSGTGMPEKVREKAFDPFFTTKELGKGTGLGLSISKGITDEHHGRIFIDGASKNTRIVVSLPKTQLKVVV